jgi:uncharacterized membrane protein
MHMQARRWSRSRILHLLYRLGIWFKGIDGVVEIIGGVLFLLVSKVALRRLVAMITSEELSEDPTDWVATHLRRAVSHFSSNTKLFASVYLLCHGALKVLLVWGGLLRGKMWAFPAAIVFLSIFIGYQVYRIVHHSSLGLLVLTAIDLGILLLIWREYRIVKRGSARRKGQG